MESLGTLAGGIAMMLAVIATAAGIVRHSKFYQRELAAFGSRELALDGLRGMAALMVATHHAALGCVWLASGRWDDAHSPVLWLFGPAGVIIFFMLTGYLFWTKARAVNGKIKVWKLWRGRLYRIAPLYLVSLFLVLLVAIIHTGGGWLTWENWKPLLRLLALGALKWHHIGDVNLDVYNGGVVWTLWYEWGFYLVLPFIAWLAIGRRIFGVAILLYCLTFLCLWKNLNLQPGMFFVLGMLCPVLFENKQARSQLCRPAAAAAALATTALLFVLTRHYLFTKVPGISVAGPLFPIFVVVAAGNSFFGFLTHPAIRCLGTLSFSLYLLHGIFFLLVFRILKIEGLNNLSQLDNWLIIIATAIPTTLICAATYRWIEFPFLSSSHKTPK
jgi:peptidoglycan/LPS O-acetylase OafA/YrhL